MVTQEQVNKMTPEEYQQRQIMMVSSVMELVSAISHANKFHEEELLQAMVMVLSKTAFDTLGGDREKPCLLYTSPSPRD